MRKRYEQAKIALEDLMRIQAVTDKLVFLFVGGLAFSLYFAVGTGCFINLYTSEWWMSQFRYVDVDALDDRLLAIQTISSSS
jgi:hypothetical protein